jgi:hypothetical protein
MSGSAVSRSVFMCVALAISSGACSSESWHSNPSSPSVLGGLATAAATGAVADSHGLRFTAVTGEGSGTLNVTATPRPGEFTLNAQVTVNVHGVPANTVLRLLRSGDIALPNGQQADGVCQRAAAGLFGAVPLHPGGPPAVVETSDGGSGALHFELQGSDPFLPDGASVDVVYRLVDALPPAVPSVDLRTPCFTFTAR